ncbi:MAG: FtsX-like permease family protein [Clostridiaceae bacterium]
MLIVVFLLLFFRGLETNLRQLNALPDAIPIEGRIHNLNGTLSSGMMIQERVVDALDQSAYVADFDYTSELSAAMGDLVEDETTDASDFTLPLCLGVNRAEAYPVLTATEVLFRPGDGPKELAGAEPVCVMQKQKLNELGFAVGDKVRMNLFNITYPGDNAMKKFHRLGEYDVTIIGSFDPTLGDGSARPAQVVFPVAWLRSIYAQKEVMFFADSARFRVVHPLELNRFKEEMKVIGLMPVISQANSTQRGTSLTVNDETFIKAATRLKENISLQRMIMPFVILIVGLLGFVVSNLLLQSRRPEIAIMRSLGVSQKSCFVMLLFESAILELSGSLAGVVAASLLVDVDVLLGLAVVAPFFIVYMAGTAVALIFLGRFSVMQVLTALD